MPTIVDNTVRSAQHFAVLEARAHTLREQFEATLPPGGEFVWEIGCGHGHFLADYAAAHRERLCYGVDISGDRVERAVRKRDRAALPNLHFVRADARLFLATLPASAKIACVFVLFPDPWPKLRHHKHRILQEDVLTSIARRAIPDCPLYFRTDHAGSFSDTSALIAAHADWRIVNEPWPHEFVTVFQSKAARFESLIARRRP